MASSTVTAKDMTEEMEKKDLPVNEHSVANSVNEDGLKRKGGDEATDEFKRQLQKLPRVELSEGDYSILRFVKRAKQSAPLDERTEMFSSRGRCEITLVCFRVTLLLFFGRQLSRRRFDRPRRPEEAEGEKQNQNNSGKLHGWFVLKLKQELANMSFGTDYFFRRPYRECQKCPKLSLHWSTSLRY